MANDQTIFQRIASELELPVKDVAAAAALLDDGNTVPFVARYRKEVTGNMDDQKLRELERSLDRIRQLEQRREDIMRLICEQDKLDSKLEQAIVSAASMAELEDLYRPFRPKRRTRAMIAREAGLLPLAQAIKSPKVARQEVMRLAAELAGSEAFPDVEATLVGAGDILAEALADSAAVRERLRRVLLREARLVSRQKQEGDSVYRLYYEFAEPWPRIKGYQVLAINRGEKEGWLKVEMDSTQIDPQAILEHFFTVQAEKQDIVAQICLDAWKRLLKPSLETELRAELTARAHEEAMQIFSANLRATLLAPPLRDKVVLAMDPGYRNGCKLAVSGKQGEVLDTDHIYPLPPQARERDSSATLLRLIKRYGVEVIAVGNGTATRETEQFAQKVLAEADLTLPMLIVNEAGASVYSASPLAAAEFPDLDVSVRSAISLARRLQDPLAELVKIEPEALGVGQYQHDMNQKELTARLDTVVEDCVNEVGCDLNTASQGLLRHIAGINDTVAKNIVAYRQEHGGFKKRDELKKVPRLGPKAFEQCAGFLRIHNGDEPLDNTSVHPESYAAARKLLKRFGLGGKSAKGIGEQAFSAQWAAADPERLAQELGIGVLTLQDMAEALEKPGRDPRKLRNLPERSQTIQGIEDLEVGMVFPGIVRNVTAFGAFVDIGVHQDGLIHISEMADQFVSNPSLYVTAGQNVTVLVLEVDVPKKRISLSMKASRLKAAEGGE